MSGHITREVAEKALKVADANLLKKVREGRTLTGPEKARLESLAAGGREADAKPTPGGRWLKNLTDLAKALRTTRPTLNKWRKLPGAPQARANNEHDLEAWRKFVTDQGLQPAEETPDLTALKARKLLAEIKEREFRVAILEKRFVEIEQIREQWQKTTNAAVMLLRKKFEDELPGVCSGLDALGIRERNKEAIDQFLRIMRGESLGSRGGARK